MNCDEVISESVDCNFANLDESEESDETAEMNLALLNPDHPLLNKFQQSLREQLLRTKEQLANEIAEIKYNLKNHEKQREELGSNLYDMQQDLKHQNELLNQHSEDIEKNVLERREKEEAVICLKEEYNEHLNMNKEQKSIYNKRMMELENMQQLEKNLRKWTDEVEDEVKNAKRVVSRDAQLQKQLSDEKRKTDMLFYHLNMEVKKREKELRDIQDEAADMREVIKVLNTSVACANTDLEVLQNEQKRLTQAWSEVIVSIQHRDKILFQVNDSLRKEKEAMKICTASIEGIKKQISKEFEQNQKLASFKLRLNEDCAVLKLQCSKESTNLTVLQEKLEKLPILSEQTEKDLLEASREGNHIERDLRRIQFKLDKHFEKKAELEENILKQAQDQLISDKASEYRLKLLTNLQEQRRTMELALAKTQNQLASTLLDIEKIKGALFKLGESNTTLVTKLSKSELRCNEVSSDFKNIEIQIDIKMKRIEKLNRHLDTLNKGNDENIACTTELKIQQVEKAIQIGEHQIREHQQFWIMLQNHFVNLSQKRNDQLNEMQVTRKQLSIIKQKSFKVDQDLENSELKTREIALEVQKFTSKIEALNEKMFKKRLEHEAEENTCELEHSDLMDKLKDNEMKVLAQESEIDEIQVDIEHYKELVLDKHREALSWETKYKLIEETLRWRKDETTFESEIGTMRAEIHRMQIRHNHLKRAQEKLVQDLDQCVLHREQIFLSAGLKKLVMIKSQKMKGVSSLVQQKIADLSQKLKQIHNEIQIISGEQLVQLKSEQDRLYRDVTMLQDQIQQESANAKGICSRIEREKLAKYLNLEQIVRKQNRVKSYRTLITSKFPPKIARSTTSIQSQSQKQLDINDNMIDLIHILGIEFPRVGHIFNKITQTLKE